MTPMPQTLATALFALALAASSPPSDPEAQQRRDARLIAAQVEAMPAQRAGVVDLYAVGFAGDGTEDVFRNEVDYFDDLARQRLRARGSAKLVNHLDSLEAAPAPLATYENLGDLLKRVGERMDPDEDVLLLYLTMHGTQDHELALYFPPIVEDLLTPEDLRSLLDASGIRHRVLVISACYSGGFVRELRDADTLIVTAARADRTSFGCGADSSVTFFGRAWMVEGLNRSNDFIAAYDYAKTRIRRWERKEGYRASHPQISVGKRIGARLRAWQNHTPPGPVLAYPHPLDDSVSGTALPPR